MAKLLGLLCRKFNDFALDHFLVVAFLLGIDHGLVARNLHGSSKQVAFVQNGCSGLDFFIAVVEFKQTVKQTHDGEIAVIVNSRNATLESQGANSKVHVVVFKAVFSLAAHGYMFERCRSRFALGVNTDVKAVDFDILD